MAEKRYVVPEGMVRAAHKAWGDHRDADSVVAVVRFELEAAIQWLAENPVKPTTDQLRGMFGPKWCDATCQGTLTGASLAALLVTWQRHMFVAPVYGVRDLLFAEVPSQPYTISRELANERVLEAYKRGREGK